MADLFGNEASTKKPPFLAYKTVTNFLDGFQDSSNIPSHIDKSVLPNSMSGGNQVYLQNALKFLGLISEDGSTQPIFHKLMQAQKNEKAAVWREILANSYNFLLSSVDIERTTTRIVADKFKEQGISGDSIRKAMTFFIFAAKEAEIKVSPHIKAQQASGKPRVRSNNSKTNDIPKQEVNSENTIAAAPEATNSMATEKELPYQLIDILNDEMSQEEEDAVWTLIRYLKKQKAKNSE